MSQIKWLCPMCGVNKKAVFGGSHTRKSPLKSLCEDCERKRAKLRWEQQKRVNDYLRSMRTL